MGNLNQAPRSRGSVRGLQNPPDMMAVRVYAVGEPIRDRSRSLQVTRGHLESSRPISMDLDYF